MLRADSRTEILRRAGLFAGAVMLAAWCARGVYYVAGCRAAWHVANYPNPLRLMFIAIGVAMMIVLHDRFLKCAAGAFAIKWMIAASPLAASDAGVVVQPVLGIAVAVLLVIAGGRHRTATTLGLAAALFVGMLAFDVGATEYASYLLSGRSVMHRPLWRSSRCI